MADETPGEAKEEDGEKEQQEFYGEDNLNIISTPESLVSDFCEPEFKGEEEGEDFGEARWICEPREEEEEYYEGEWEKSYEELAEEAEETEELVLDKRRSLDSQYLKSVLGTPLTFALLDIAMKRPTDPIQYLGAYLLNWRWCQGDKSEYLEKMKALDAEREAYRERLREKERQDMLEREQKEEELRRAEREESSIEDDDILGEDHDFELEDV